jgi:hypothetical protein
MFRDDVGNRSQGIKEARLAELFAFLNQVGRNEYIDVRPVLREIVALLDLPSYVVKEPQPTPPAPPAETA